MGSNLTSVQLVSPTLAPINTSTVSTAQQKLCNFECKSDNHFNPVLFKFILTLEVDLLYFELQNHSFNYFQLLIILFHAFFMLIALRLSSLSTTTKKNQIKFVQFLQNLHLHITFHSKSIPIIINPTHTYTHTYLESVPISYI